MLINVMCRAELHKATTNEQYKEFHALQSGNGLERTITRDGKVYKLPTGEYLGVDLGTSLKVLSLMIKAAAILVTGYPCKLTLTPVNDISEIYIADLEEEESYAMNLGAFSSLAAIAMSQSKGGPLSSPQTVPNSLQTSLLDTLARSN